MRETIEMLIVKNPISGDREDNVVDSFLDDEVSPDEAEAEYQHYLEHVRPMLV